MLKPHTSPTREPVHPHGFSVAVDFGRAGHTDRCFAASSDGAPDMGAPGSRNNVFAASAVRGHAGEVRYQRGVLVPRGWVNDRIHRTPQAAAYALRARWAGISHTRPASTGKGAPE